MQNIDANKTIHPIIKMLATEVKDSETRIIPFDYDKHAAVIE